MKTLISFLIIIFVFNSIIFACSMRPAFDLPIAKVDKQKYIFVGEVIGYTETIKSKINSGTLQGDDKFYGEGRGLKIKPFEIINMPNSSDDYVELFQFGVTPWCLPKVSDAPFPIGTKLRIIADEATVLPNRSPENRIRIESNIFDHLSVVSETDEFNVNTASVFDYKNWKPMRGKILNAKSYERLRAFDDFILIEINKDLLRLEKAKPKQERYEILERLIYAPKIDFSKIVSPKLGGLKLISIDKYERLPNLTEGSSKKVKLTSTEKNLLKKREELEKSGYFKL